MALSQKEIKRIKVMVYNRSDKPSASRRGNDAASRHKRPAQHLRLTAAESWPSAYEPLSEADHQAQEEVHDPGRNGTHPRQPGQASPAQDRRRDTTQRAPPLPGKVSRLQLLPFHRLPGGVQKQKERETSLLPGRFALSISGIRRCSGLRVAAALPIALPSSKLFSIEV